MWSNSYFSRLPNICFEQWISAHNTKNVINSGIKKIPNLRTIFSNAAIVEDGKFNKIVSNGNYFEIIDKQVKIYE